MRKIIRAGRSGCRPKPAPKPPVEREDDQGGEQEGEDFAKKSAGNFADTTTPDKSFTALA